jgi:hypothetical protein
MAAFRCPQVRALIAVAPVISGRRYLRELRTFERAAMAVNASSAPQKPSREPELAANGDMEVSARQPAVSRSITGRANGLPQARIGS